MKKYLVDMLALNKISLMCSFLAGHCVVMFSDEYGIQILSSTICTLNIFLPDKAVLKTVFF